MSGIVAVRTVRAQWTVANQQSLKKRKLCSFLPTSCQLSGRCGRRGR